MRITRRFHPVGQGAFYSEVINVGKKTFCMVYDCGSALGYEQYLSTSIQTSGLPKEIDVLFISHFDWDHISGVSELLNKRTVKNIFIPFLSKEQEWYFRAFIRSISIQNRIQIYFVRAIEDEGEHNDDNENTSDETDTNENTENKIISKIIDILSSIGILSKITTLWKYKLFCSKGENSTEESVAEDIKNLEDYFVSNSIDSEEDLLRYTPEELQTILKECKGKIGVGRNNRYCLCVLSTPANPKINWRFTHINNCCRHYYHCCCRCGESPTCLYLGDSSLKVNSQKTNKLSEDLKKHYKDELRLIETIQVPHHGSDKNHNIDFYQKLCNLKFAVCSFGLYNTYHHPSSQVVKDIVVNGYCFISVTQTPSSEYIQIYDYVK